MTDELATVAKGVNEGLAAAQAFQIVTEQDHAFACQQLILVKTNSKHFLEQKETATKPLNAGLKAVRDMFRPIENALSAMELCLKQKIGKYEQDKKNEEQKTLAEAATLFQTGQQELGIIALNAVPEVAVQKQQGVSTRKVIKFRVVDPNLVPREFCQPVDALIRARVSLSGMGTNIPGVQVYEDIQVTGRI